MSVPCIICGNTQNNTSFEVQEHQMGIGHLFHYQQCGACHSAQLLDPPADFAPYYQNDNYYSFHLELRLEQNIVRKIQTGHILFGKYPIIGHLLTLGYTVNEFIDWMKQSGARYDDAILDVGTGNGSLLTKLYQAGFKDLTGIDPFIEKEVSYEGVRIERKSIFDVTHQYDLVMMHHSLEHMPDPKAALRKAYEIIKPGKTLLVRIPIMNNYGWRTYGRYWCGLDAPRHIFIPSEQGLKQMAEEAGFVADKFYYDSFDYVVWCSEQYKQNIALNAPNSWMVNKEKSLFTKEQVKSFRQMMKQRNKAMDGDMGALYLKKPL
jgi:SAM-dependent methyltransferase